MAEAARELRPLYKKLLRLAQSLPEPKRQTSIEQIRREFRSHEDLTDPKECEPVSSLFAQSCFVSFLRSITRVSKLLQRAQSSLGYLKIVTPRAESNTGVQRFIYRDGKRVNAEELEGKGEENARWKTQDMEAGLKRHHQLLRRQYFMDRKSGPPRPIF